MTAEEALEIIVDRLEKHTADLARCRIEDGALDYIETIAIFYDEMDYEAERDMVEDEGCSSRIQYRDGCACPICRSQNRLSRDEKRPFDIATGRRCRGPWRHGQPCPDVY